MADINALNLSHNSQTLTKLQWKVPTRGTAIALSRERRKECKEFASPDVKFSQKTISSTKTITRPGEGSARTTVTEKTQEQREHVEIVRTNEQGGLRTSLEVFETLERELEEEWKVAFGAKARDAVLVRAFDHMLRGLRIVGTIQALGGEIYHWYYLKRLTPVNAFTCKSPLIWMREFFKP